MIQIRSEAFTEEGERRTRYTVTDTEESEDRYEAKLRVSYPSLKGEPWFDCPKRGPKCWYPRRWVYVTKPNPKYKGPPYTGDVVVQFIDTSNNVRAKERLPAGDPVRATADNPGATTVQVAQRTFNVYIVDICPPDHGRTGVPWNQQSMEEIVRTGLERDSSGQQQYMRRAVLCGSPPFQDVRLHWGRTMPASFDTGTHELMVYLCLWSQTALRGTSAWQDITNPDGTPIAGGATLLRPDRRTVICEVWPDRISHGFGENNVGALLVNLIYHEWMHVKMDCDIEEEVVHPMGGLGTAIQEPYYTASDANIQVMAKNVHKEWRYLRRTGVGR